jgi:FtsP/CotA-like multicopper oxidase with cupredoxin domain
MALWAVVPGPAPGEQATPDCPARPAVGSVVGEPLDLHSAHGKLRVDLSYRRSVDADGRTHYCYVSPDGGESPTLRLKPGDLLILRLRNAEPAAPVNAMPTGKHSMSDGCTAGRMDATSTNLHFHGLSVPPICHQDDVLNTLIQPGDRPFEYRFRIPANEPPGLYWYHPHVHGLTSAQVLGGASGALIVEGIERANPLLAGLAERVLVIRDQELLNPDAAPVQTDSMPPPMVLRDAEGDILNTGTGGGKPAKDLSINFVPVPYPSYAPAVIRLRPGERQLWRILNASAITYLDLQLLVDNQLQALGVVGLDGVPTSEKSADTRIVWQSHALVPPAGRIEFIVKGPSAGVQASLVTRTVDTGPVGENDPTRPLATIISEPQAPTPRVRLDAAPLPLPPSSSPWAGDVKPVRTRKLYFSESPRNPQDPNGPTDFFITVEGRKPKLFDPGAKDTDIIVQQGDVEDWIIENRTRELHAFHIHQIHFMLLDWNGIPLDEPFLRDTVNVAYWDGQSPQYPSVRLRMDFRDPSAVGTFVYHCHLLEHEDGGMMGLIRVEPRAPIKSASRGREPGRIPHS